MRNVDRCAAKIPKKNLHKVEVDRFGATVTNMPTGEKEHQSLVDMETINKLIARIGQEGVDELLAILFDDLPQYLVGLHEAVKKGDRKTLHTISHILKSSCGALGLTALSSQCKSLSEVNAKMPLVEAEYRVTSIEDIYIQTAAFLRRNCVGKRAGESK
ncbi:MAG: Hpt domain-containing protein [Candidatus Polarisedimenticolaceae bacterium]|nr:Hpt domain-containing protein [Candidatus Polarisedimenticolaceae bacterium]